MSMYWQLPVFQPEAEQSAKKAGDFCMHSCQIFLPFNKLKVSLLVIRSLCSYDWISFQVLKSCYSSLNGCNKQLLCLKKFKGKKKETSQYIKLVSGET